MSSAYVNSSLPADHQPLTACPMCSTELCPHLVCRTCGECPECDRDEVRGQRVNLTLNAALSPQQLSAALKIEMDEARTKALDALSRYKFQMFGYWAAIWVHLNRISGARQPNPFACLVAGARAMTNATTNS